jgi:hypothetical protein
MGLHPLLIGKHPTGIGAGATAAAIELRASFGVVMGGSGAYVYSWRNISRRSPNPTELLAIPFQDSSTPQHYQCIYTGTDGIVGDYLSFYGDQFGEFAELRALEDDRDTSLNGPCSLTIHAIVMRIAGASTIVPLLQWGSTDNQALDLAVNQSTAPHVRIRTNANSPYLTNTVLSLNTWHSLIVRWRQTGTTAQITAWVDGAITDDIAAGTQTPPALSIQNLKLGRYSAWYAASRLAEFELYTSALSSSAIASLVARDRYRYPGIFV